MKLLTFLLLISFGLFSQVKLDYLIELDEQYTKNVLVVEKSTHKLYVYSLKDQVLQLTKSFEIASGKSTGNKAYSGDRKTPEGIYFLKEFFSHDFLISKYGKSANIYGAGAFTLNYPNQFDRLNKKTGHGIWLHSTDDDTRVSKGLDSKGCVVATDSDIKEISTFIELDRTPIIIAEDLTFLKDETFNINKAKIKYFFNSWAQSWQTKNFNSYISHYSKKHFYDNRKGNYNSYRRYKKAIFSRSQSPQISFSDMSILKFKDTAIISMTQDYKSSNINDIGRKVLYLKMNDKYEWRIIKESWTKLKPKINNEFFSKVSSNDSI